MDMTASVSGEQCPAADDVGNFLQARIEVTMHNYNDGMGATEDNSDLKSVGTRMSSKTSEYNLYNAIDGVASPYELAAAGSNACPVGRAVLQEDCLSAGSLVGGRSCGGLTTGHWGWVPTGCSINPGSKCTHWNTHSAPNSPDWQPVCKAPTTTTTTSWLGDENGHYRRRREPWRRRRQLIRRRRDTSQLSNDNDDNNDEDFNNDDLDDLDDIKNNDDNH